MAGIKRFITYIYAYENGTKGINAGFAKVKIRGNECRIEVHLRGTPIRMGMDQVYLFKVEGGQMLAFPMGEMRMIKGSGDYGTIIVDNVKQSRPSLPADMTTLLLKLFISASKKSFRISVSALYTVICHYFLTSVRFRNYRPVSDLTALTGIRLYIIILSANIVAAFQTFPQMVLIISMSLQIRDLTVKLKVILHIFMGNAQTVKRTVNGTVPVVLRTVQLSIKNIRKSIDKIYFLN